MIFFCAIFPICVGKVARFNLTGISTRECGNLPFELDQLRKQSPSITQHQGKTADCHDLLPNQFTISLKARWQKVSQ
ncbi:MAG TPA: hypothetical protein DD636_07225 [Anaerolineaceae bacterium]|nr:hypothetical protein [Anaerolineaceae bacterium]